MRIPLVAGLLVTLIYFPLGENRSALYRMEDPQKAVLEQAWVDSVYNALSEDERIAQLMMVRAHSNLGEDHIKKVTDLVETHKVGGLCFYQGTPEKQAELTNLYQSKANVPLLISIDAEWGLGMRMKASTISFPRQLMLGAIQDNRLIYNFGKEVGRQCRKLGIHINFAPVVDVNNNPDNPVINERSFGEDRYNVTSKSYMYAMGMQDNGLIACAKHFPGHGDTDTDSHFALPVINHDQQRLDSIELYPFRVLAQHGLGSMMMGHLFIPALDSTKDLPSSLSRKIVTGILQEELDYDGLVITDGLGMKGASGHSGPGQLELRALIAGNDILLNPQDVPAAMRTIKRGLISGYLIAEEFEQKVKKVLRAKYTMGLNNFTPIDPATIREVVNDPNALALKEHLVRNALTLVRNEDRLLPIFQLEGKKMASLSIGSTVLTDFQKTLGLYHSIKHVNTKKDISSSASKSLLNQLKDYDTVFVGLHDMKSSSSSNFGVTASTITFLEQLRVETNVVLVVFGNPYSLHNFDNFSCVLQAYNEDNMTQKMSAQAIFGAFGLSGKLPITASPISTFNTGIETKAVDRLQYAVPESAGLDSRTLKKIDDIANEAVNIKATPGLQVIVAKDGKVVHNKAYGYHTYAKKRTVRENDIFDLASVTKIAATTISIIKLQDEGKLSIFEPIGKYLPILKGSNKENLKIRDVMAHRAGLKAWIPFYEETLTKSKRPDPKIYRTQKSGDFNVRVAEKLYMHKSYVDSIWTKIIDSELRSSTDYKYSDLGFYMLSMVVSEITGIPFEEYVQTTFYKPLGLTTATFNPLDQFSKNRIIPSERDDYFRYETLRGYVHDMGAGMLGGVSGHAGLFANGNDVAVIMQMLLNEGTYGGIQFFRPETLQLFNTRHERDTRRGIGFDMYQTNPNKSPNISTKSSVKTFGHLGFTGIGAWADPDNEVIYIFLSNRTYPSMDNWKLNKEDIRPRIQDVIYEAMR
ncbi:MAG: glycoside hydrolase family 3 N-terminal domain-containing protein [Bacteroidota bacterium]